MTNLNANCTGKDIYILRRPRAPELHRLTDTFTACRTPNLAYAYGMKGIVGKRFENEDGETKNLRQHCINHLRRWPHVSIFGITDDDVLDSFTIYRLNIC